MSEDWFWEGHVQQRVAEHFLARGWQVRSMADTAARQAGVDLILEREGDVLKIEVKGWPSTTYARGARMGQPKPTNPTVQARHWFAGALLSAVLLRDAEPSSRVAIAFPDVSRYRDLLARTGGSLTALHIETLLVGDDGHVEAIDARTLPVDGRTPPVASLRARRQPPAMGGHVGKYRALWEWLRARRDYRVVVTFKEVEELLGFQLPASCYRHTAHWASYEGSAVARAIANAGWKARPDLRSQRVTFDRPTAT